MNIFFSALVLLSLITGGYGSCSTNQEVERRTTLRSPGYPQQRSQHSCRKYRATYKSLPGTTLSIECPEFSIQCRGQNNFLLVMGGKKKCGRSFPKATTSGNVLKVEYTARFNRAPTSSKRTVFMFKCKIEVLYPEPSFSSCNCGVQEPTVSTRLDMGRYAEEGEFPHMVAILRKSKLVCGGSLIAEKWVVTSASCDITTRHRVRLGFVSLKDESANEEYRNVKSVTAHPGFDVKTRRYSVALVELNKPVAFSSSIRPICLPDDLDEDPLVQDRGIAAGWGRDENAELPDVLKKVHLTILSNMECTHYVPYDETMCTKAHGRENCKYDEGGPLQYTRYGKVYLVGVASVTNRECSGEDTTESFTRISTHRILSWIRDTMDEQCEKPTMPFYSCNVCGKRMPSSQHTRIVGGNAAGAGEFPYQVVLATDSSLYCGGSLISDRWVLTAAHCIASKYLDNVVLGEFDRTELENPNRQIRRMARVVNHPKFDEATFEYDVALIELEERVNFTDYIQPACVPDGFREESFAGKQGIATGWGALQHGGEYATRLNKVTLDVITNEQCIELNTDYIYPASMCTFTPEKDTCQGDSGGTLAYQQDGRLYLIGVTSWGYGCATPTYAGVFTRLTDPSIVSWIKKTAGIMCDAP